MIERIISGGQTGADAAGVFAGEALGLTTGGCIPRGRRTDEGEMSEEIFRRFGFVEHTERGYPSRTEVNVIAADATVIFGRASSAGCQMTIRFCRMHGKPYKVNPTVDEFRKWVRRRNIKVLNVAGNRERTNPGIFARVYTFLVDALTTTITLPLENAHA